MRDIFGIALSFVVVALMVYAVILFITSGATSLFYTVVLIDLAVSFINAWFIRTGKYEKLEGVVKKEGLAGEIVQPATRRRARRKRRGKARG